MAKSDEENLQLIETVESGDQLNKEFYEKYPYPWAPMKFEGLLDPDFEAIMLNQTIGDWSHKTILPGSKIWVAGCGTSQAVYTALKYPNATVLGSDLSTISLEHSANIASKLGITNLTHTVESIHHTCYEGEFDYIICTGVIHHTAHPVDTLHKLSRALKPTGILELMVYNRFHRIETSALQKAVRILNSARRSNDFARELFIAKTILEQADLEHPLAKHLENYKDSFDNSFLADVFIQPVEHSYTVESLEEIAQACNLEFILPAINAYDKVNQTYWWNIEFQNPELRGFYEALPDLQRWQVTNLLLLEKSPMLDFYFQRKDSNCTRKTEKQVCEEFLNTTFVKTSTLQKMHIRNNEGIYVARPQPHPFPRFSPKGFPNDIYQLVNGKITMQEIFNALNIEPVFSVTNKARIQLTTSAFPYIKAIHTSA